MTSRSFTPCVIWMLPSGSYHVKWALVISNIFLYDLRSSDVMFLCFTFLRVKSSHMSVVLLKCLPLNMISLSLFTVKVVSPITNVSPYFRIPYCVSRKRLLQRYGVKYGLNIAPNFYLPNLCTSSLTKSSSSSSSSPISRMGLCFGSRI